MTSQIPSTLTATCTQPDHTQPVSSTLLPDAGEQSPSSLKRKRNIEVLTPRRERARKFYRQSVPELNTPEAEKRFSRILREKNGLSFGTAMKTNPTQRLPGTLTTEQSLKVMEQKIGEGSQAAAYLAKEIPFDGRSPKKVLVKFARKPFSPQKKILGRLNQHPGVDTLGESGRVVNETRFPLRFVICEVSSGDLTKIEYSSDTFVDTYQKEPVSFFVDQMTTIAQTLSAFHQAGKIHRDLKGGNLLFNIGGHGKLTDFDLIMDVKQDGELHSIGMTPGYAPSWIYEKVTDQRITLPDQRVTSKGHQCPESDVYALGVVLQRDGLKNILNGLLELNGIPDRVDLKPTIHVEPFTDQEMEAISAAHKGAVNYVYPSQRSGRPGFLLKSIPREEALGRMEAAIKALESKLTPQQMVGLRSLAKLAHDLQAPTKEEIPPMEDVAKELVRILNSLES